MKKNIWTLLALVALITTVATSATASVVTAIDNSSGTAAIQDLSFKNDLQGIVFQTGATSSAIANLTLSLTPWDSGTTTGTFTERLYAVDNSTNLPTTELTLDSLSYSLTGPFQTSNNLLYTGSAIANLSGYTLAPNTKYALVIGDSSQSLVFWATGGGTNTGYTTNGGYSVVASSVTYGSNPPDPINPFASTGSSWHANDYSNIIKLDVVNVVPEPSTYALLCISLGVVGYARKRMNKVTPE
jgi:PEP-CTERM motif